MTRGLALAASLLGGVGIGWLCERLPVVPLLQTIAAGVLGVFIGSLAAAVFWLMNPPPEAPIVAVSFGLAESVVVMLTSAFVALVLHSVLGAAAVMAYLPLLAAHRAILVGVIASLYGASAALSGAGLVTPMGR